MSFRTVGNYHIKIDKVVQLLADSEKRGNQVIGQAYSETQTISVDYNIRSGGIGGL